VRALGQNLERVPLGFPHDIEDRPDELQRDVFVKQVAHRVDKDHSGLRPTQGLLQSFWATLKIKATLVRVAWDASEALGKGFGVAMGAARAHF
jgi:hypothetical protein